MATRLIGRLMFVTADRNGALLKLDNDPKDGPKDNTWRLDRGHTNYNALFSLLLTAAANRWPVHVRIEGDEEISSEREAGVRHVSVAWQLGDV